MKESSVPDFQEKNSLYWLDRVVFPVLYIFYLFIYQGTKYLRLITLLVNSVITHLNPMIVSVGNDVLANAIHGNASETIELAFTASVLTELLYEYAIWVEHLEKIWR